jgi:hypothetical protein
MEEITEIFSQAEYSGYDWTLVAIVRRGNEFAVYSDSGCSCNVAYAEGWESDLSWTRDLYEIGSQVRERIRWLYNLSAGERSGAMARLHQLMGDLKKERP